MQNIMQAYKLKGKIDSSGKLVITDPLNLPPGDVEIVVWEANETLDNKKTQPAPETPKRKSRIKAFEGLFENAPPVPADFDADQAKYEYLKEKYNL
jgi:hypothetical protein